MSYICADTDYTLLLAHIIVDNIDSDCIDDMFATSEPKVKKMKMNPHLSNMDVKSKKSDNDNKDVLSQDFGSSQMRLSRMKRNENGLNLKNDKIENKNILLSVDNCKLNNSNSISLNVNTSDNTVYANSCVSTVADSTGPTSSPSCTLDTDNINSRTRPTVNGNNSSNTNQNNSKGSMNTVRLNDDHHVMRDIIQACTRSGHSNASISINIEYSVCFNFFCRLQTGVLKFSHVLCLID